MSVKSFSTMPDALLLTSTFVMGWIFPVAITERATSPRVTFAMRFASMEEPLTSRATAAPAMARMSTRVTAPQIQIRFLFFDAATTYLQPARQSLVRAAQVYQTRSGLDVWVYVLAREMVPSLSAFPGNPDGPARV